ncbi:MAG TPA: hypothetical protein VMW66_01575 [Elusimicrobiales bacterium]|nr:hypothetical protein [Elusimicrobiales bacterium]
MEIFWKLVLAYLINEFIAQTDFLGYWKNFNFKKILLHNTIFLALALILNFSALSQIWITVYGLHLNGWLTMAGIFILFISQDLWRTYTLKNFKLFDNTLHFLWDQFIHLTIIFVMTPITGFAVGAIALMEKTAMLLSIFVAVACGATVLIYFIERDIYKADYPGFDERFLLSAQRIVLCLFFLIPGFYWIILMLLWIVYGVYLKHERILDFSRLGIYLGFALSILAGFIARYIFLY